MYVCICKGVTETQIFEAIGRGLCTRKEIAGCLKAGTGCGKCSSDIRELLQRTGSTKGANAAPLKGDGKERKHSEPRRYVATGRTRRIAHGSASLTEKSTREPAANVIQNS